MPTAGTVLETAELTAAENKILSEFTPPNAGIAPRSDCIDAFWPALFSEFSAIRCDAVDADGRRAPALLETWLV